MRHILSILVENEAGALSRISGLFSARGYNIESLTVAPTEDDSRFAKAMYGTVRSVIAGMVKGASEGYVKDLEIQGVGFKANLKGTVISGV